MKIIPRRDNPDPASDGSEVLSAVDGNGVPSAAEQRVEDAGADNHPSRDKGDIYIETNDADNTVFEDPVQEREARDGLFTLASAALRSQGLIK